MLRIGKIVATHALQGKVVLTHILDDSDWLKPGDAVFVELVKGSFIPYFVTECKAAQDEYIVKFEEVDTLEQARRLVSRAVYVDEKVLEAHANDSPLLWVGFEIVDKHYGPLGPIVDMMSTAAQWLAKIDYKGKEALLPMVEQTITGINLKKKQIFTSLPQGLLEVYL